MVYNTKNEEEFEDTYHIVGPTEDMDEDDIIVKRDVADSVSFICENAYDVISFVIIYEKFKILKRVTNTFYGQSVLEFGGFV
ncbi:hypothetical protein Ahy_A09g045689 isoform B [Arachis hypogaea]|uniref:Uncharacterized protein n=1 Tax=Arachis hypogaea TaxID=3818 RepID=A0A445BMX0_ARAHY|nr:hypothetical protein Ahy_A09g045689 isoform B [Arachis hypogaea]